jgi:hypothetical protein
MIFPSFVDTVMAMEPDPPDLSSENGGESDRLQTVDGVYEKT